MWHGNDCSPGTAWFPRYPTGFVSGNARHSEAHSRKQGLRTVTLQHGEAAHLTHLFGDASFDVIFFAITYSNRSTARPSFCLARLALCETVWRYYQSLCKTRQAKSSRLQSRWATWRLPKLISPLSGDFSLCTEAGCDSLAHLTARHVECGVVDINR